MPEGADEASSAGDAGGGRSDASLTLGQMGKDIFQQLLPLAFGAGGLAAFVFGVGGAVSVARFYAAGLPPNQAVNAASESDMQAIGLTWLVVFGLLGVLAVILAWVASPQGKATAAMYYVLIGIAAAEAGVVWALGKHATSWGGIWGNEWKKDLGAAAVLAGATVAAGAVVLRRHRVTRRAEAEERRRTAKETSEVTGPAGGRDEHGGPESAKLRDGDPRGEQPAKDKVLRITAEAKNAGAKRGELPLALHIWEYGLLAGLSVGAAVGAGLLLERSWVAVSLMLAGALGLLTIRVAALKETDRAGFAWYGVCVFFSVALFGGVLGVLRMLDEPRLQPVAFLLTEGNEVKAMQGVYVGESDDRLWFASVALDDCGDSRVRRGSGRLRWVPQKHVSDVTIGPSVGLPKLAHESRAMLDDLIAEHPGTEVVVGPGAVRDAVAVEEFGKTRKASGWWVPLGSSNDLGDHPRLTLNGQRLRLRRSPGDQDRWQIRLPRDAREGAVYAECGERTNSAWLNVPGRPYAMPTATDLGEGRWRLDARGSVDLDGQIQSYMWTFGDETLWGRTIEIPPEKYAARATLEVIDDDGGTDHKGAANDQGLKDDRDVRLAGTVSRTFPSDLLFCMGCRQLSDDGRRRIRDLRSDVVGARRVLIYAHTDERRGAGANRELSQARADVIATALLSRLDVKPRHRARGMGEDDLSQQGDHRQNRRVEIIIYRSPRSS